MTPIKTALLCLLLPAGLLAVTMKDVADARCDERCKIKDYTAGSYLGNSKCRCTDDIDFDLPIAKLPANSTGRAVITPTPPTVIRIEY